MKPCKLLSWHSKYSKVIQLSINIGIPLAKQRDAIVLGNGYHLREYLLYNLQCNVCIFIPYPNCHLCKYVYH